MKAEGERDRSLAAGGWGLIAVWAVWGGQSFAANHLVGPDPWFYPWRTLGTDFMHNFLAVHFVAGGGNPYLHDFGDYRGLYAYPPIVIGLFYWCVLFPVRMARESGVVWAVAVAGMIGVAAGRACVGRRRMGLVGLPLPLILGAVFLSTPVVFA